MERQSIVENVKTLHVTLRALTLGLCEYLKTLTMCIRFESAEVAHSSTTVKSNPTKKCFEANSSWIFAAEVKLWIDGRLRGRYLRVRMRGAGEGEKEAMGTRGIRRCSEGR